MKSSTSEIVFERRSEVEELMDFVEKYIEQNPEEKNNTVLEEFYRLLDVIGHWW